MEDALPARPLLAPWTARLYARAGVAPGWTGCAIALAVILSYALPETLLWQLDPGFAGADHAGLPRDLQSVGVNALLIGYAPTAQILLARWTREHVAQIAPLLRRPPRFFPAGSAEAPAARFAGAAGAVGLFALFYLKPGDFGLYADPDYWIFPHIWLWATVGIVGWLTARLVYAMIATSRHISHLAADLDRFDLLDPGSLRPFVRHGLRSALLIVILASIGSILLVAPTTAGEVLVLLPPVFVVAAATLALPVRGVRMRIQQEKRARLSRIREEIAAGERAILAEGPEATRAAERLPGLLALEARIAGVHEWPFDAPTLWRFALYIGLGLGSWVGAAAVERLLDRLLG